jgi:hypothetical protein
VHFKELGFLQRDTPLKKDVKVKIGTRNCTLPKWDETKRTGTVLEKLSLRFFVRKAQLLELGYQMVRFSTKIYMQMARVVYAGGADSMFKRISSSDLDLEAIST